MRLDILQIILSGEARRPRQIVKVLNSEGKVIAYAKPRCPMVNYYLIFIICLISAEPVSILVPLQCPFHLFFFLTNMSFSSYDLIDFITFFLQVKGSDTSTAESGSEAEDIASPKTVKSYSHLRLTPVREEVSVGLVFC
jgi:hypothetical protein